jgi:anti-anti-sigma regulatory factor
MHRNLFSEIKAELFLNLGPELDIQVEKEIRITNQHVQKGTSPHYVTVKLSKV